MQAESPRKCKMCGGPNHYGCGCEAKAAKEWLGPTAKAIPLNAPPGGQPESEAPAAETQTPAEPTPAEQKRPIDMMIENILRGWSKEDISKILEGSFDMAKDIKTMADGFEGLCACMYDTNNYLKVIASDMITIKNLLTSEAGRNQDAPENKN